MQITSYDVNLCFFMDKITIYVIIQNTTLILILKVTEMNEPEFKIIGLVFKS